MVKYEICVQRPSVGTILNHNALSKYETWKHIQFLWAIPVDVSVSCTIHAGIRLLVFRDKAACFSRATVDLGAPPHLRSSPMGVLMNIVSEGIKH